MPEKSAPKLTPTLTLPTTIRVEIHREADGSFWADSVDAPGCYTNGATIEETLKNYQEALLCHFDISADTAAQTHFELEPIVTAQLRVALNRKLTRK